MLKKALFALAICTGVASVISVSLACYTHWPDKDSSLPAWIQAWGAIGAILAAWLGIYWQLRHLEEKAARDEIEAQRRVIVALLAELEVYSKALADISKKVSNNLGVMLSGTLQMIFPSASFRFAVYRANTDKVWAIPDDRIRAVVVGVYAEMDLFFALLDRNSAIAEGIREDEIVSGQIAEQLRGLYPIIQEQLDELLPDVAKLRTDLQTQANEMATALQV